MTRHILTHYDPPPIPIRNHDWTAVLDNYDEGDPIGSGRTRDEAIADLEEQLAERAANYADRIEARCVELTDEMRRCVERCKEMEGRNDG
jgi:hypothetical protein